MPFLDKNPLLTDDTIATIFPREKIVNVKKVCSNVYQSNAGNTLNKEKKCLQCIKIFIDEQIYFENKRNRNEMFLNLGKQ